MNLSHGKIDRLGDKLRVGAGPDDFQLLQCLRAEYTDALDAVARQIRGVVPQDFGYELTTRIKTETTIIEKLRREPGMQLSRMQDIAGARMVADGGRLSQDRIVAAVVASVDGAKVVDRRVNHSFGYRAVHVIIKLDGRPVELQVRTRLQDKWAQLTERLGDMWGRQIRYGDPPSGAETVVGPDVTRADVLEYVMRSSDQLAEVEDTQKSLEKMRAQFTDLLDSEDLEVSSSAGERLALLRGLEEKVNKHLRDLDDLLRAIGEVAK